MLVAEFAQNVIAWMIIMMVVSSVVLLGTGYMAGVE